MSGWKIWPVLPLVLLGAAPATALTALPRTVPPAPARPGTEVVMPDPGSADLTVVGGLWSLRPGGTGTAFISVANGGPATAQEPSLTIVLPRELSATGTTGCRQATSSLSPERVTTIVCHWKRIVPADYRLVALKLKAARLTADDADRARPQVKLEVASRTPEAFEDDNFGSFRVRIQPLAPAPAKEAGR